MVKPKTRVLGDMLSWFVGEDVVVLGRVTKIGFEGKTVELTTFDNTNINVAMPNMIEVMLTDVLEVWGTVRSKKTIMARHCIVFNEKHCENFDEKAYNDLITILNAVKKRRWMINHSKNPYT